MKKLLFTIFFLHLILSGFCQNLILDQTLIGTKYRLSFPLLIATDPKVELATTSINDYIQLQILHKKISKSKIHLFEEFDLNKDCDYEVFTNSKTLLSLRLNSGYPFLLNFNAQNGRLIELNSLFIESKVSELFEKRRDILKNRISQKLSGLTRDKNYEIISNFFKTKINEFYDQYYIKNKKLYLYTSDGNSELLQSNLDAKANIDWIVEFDISTIDNMLSDFGKKLISNTGDISEVKIETNSIKFLKGKLDDKYSITMVLNLVYNNQTKSYDIDESYYWYDKTGVGLYLIGSHYYNEYSLEVYDIKSRSTKEYFNFKFDKGRFIGQWKEASSGRVMKFEASDYYEFGL